MPLDENEGDSSFISVNESILRRCHSLYDDPVNGLVKMAQDLDLKLLAPRKKVTVMLIGNHSAGKSTFINWYIDENVQKTGVAIETQGFAFVTSGKKRETLTGNATLHLYPHFKSLRNIKGVVNYLTTEISASRQKKFKLVTFVDTPGLVDGDMNYPFDVNNAIFWLGGLADLIFVFFDPIGQALCKRTVTIVEKLNEKYGDRVRFYLSKADEAGHESDRQRVLMQIVQELCKKPVLNRTSFDMPTIYIPDKKKNALCVNQIEEACKEIDKTINHTVQHTLNTLENDCKRMVALMDEKICGDNISRSSNFQSGRRGLLFGSLAFLMPALLFTNFLATNQSLQYYLHSLLGETGATYLHLYLAPVRGFWFIIPEDYHLWALVGVLLLCYVMFLFARATFSRRPTLSRRQKQTLLQQREYIQNYVKGEKRKLYEEYLQQCIADQDL